MRWHKDPMTYCGKIATITFLQTNDAGQRTRVIELVKRHSISLLIKSYQIRPSLLKYAGTQLAGSNEILLIAMESLFPIQIKFPDGFTYVPEFLDVNEEKALDQEISQVQLHTFIFRGFEAKRKVATFGYDYSFDKKTVSTGNDIPFAFKWLIKKVNNYLNREHEFAELLITEYPIGSVINWHRDAPPFDIIAGISLLSDCIFRFRPHDKSRQGRKSIISFPVKRRSLYIMQGQSRSDWEHSILPVEETRYSITLRTLRI